MAINEQATENKKDTPANEDAEDEKDNLNRPP